MGHPDPNPDFNNRIPGSGSEKNGPDPQHWYKMSVVDECILKTRELCYHFPPRFKKESGSIQHAVHNCAVLRYDVNNTRVEFLCNFVTPTLPLPPFRDSTVSCLFTQIPKKAGFCRYTHFNDYPLYPIF